MKFSLIQNAGVPNYLVMTVKASDRDPGENGRVSYHLKVGNKNVQETEEFAIDQETGELRAKIILDREVKNKFEVSVFFFFRFLQFITDHYKVTIYLKISACTCCR